MIFSSGIVYSLDIGRTMHIMDRKMRTDLRLSQTTYTRLNNITEEVVRSYHSCHLSEARKLTDDDRITEI